MSVSLTLYYISLQVSLLRFSYFYLFVGTSLFYRYTPLNENVWLSIFLLADFYKYFESMNQFIFFGAMNGPIYNFSRFDFYWEKASLKTHKTNIQLCFKVVEGRQEDAEEFLTCLLNGTSDEMQTLIKQVVQVCRGVFEAPPPFFYSVG